eukprot:1157342-Pelagomonas_calceolata.AAC.11
MCTFHALLNNILLLNAGILAILAKFRMLANPFRFLHAGAAWSMSMQYLGQKGPDCPCGNMRET